jgi:hypothetical protein
MEKKKEKQPKTVGDAKGKASFDQNGEGASPKYGAAGDKPNESGKGMDKIQKKKS